jgi:CO/xanthine dehydrogenase Mo-binding subunit
LPDFTTIGQSTPLAHAKARLTGNARYVADVVRPGMLHARLVTSLYAHATVRAVDAQSALALPGVVAVLSAVDLPDPRLPSRSQVLLARGRVLFAGQPIALVLATDEAAAQDGAQLVSVTYEPHPAATSMADALASGAPLVWPQGVPSGHGDIGMHGAQAAGQDDQASLTGNVISDSTFARGDIAQGFSLADVVISRTFTTCGIHQGSMETHGVLVEPDLATGGARVWASTQGHFEVRREVASALGVPEEQVQVEAMVLGGGFGGKAGALYEPLVALAARAVGRPVRLLLTRSEEFLATAPAPATRTNLRIGAKRDGTLTALEAEVWVDNGCFPFGLSKFMAMLAGSYYRAPHLRLRGRDVLTFKPPAGAYRAPGGAPINFALESLIDELAGALKLDPLELRLLNAARTGDPMGDGRPWDDMSMRQVLEALRGHPAWQERGTARVAGCGIGIAVGGWLGGVEPALALCGLSEDGVITVQTGAVDISGTATGFAILAAEALGLDVSQVRVITGDTAAGPYAAVSSASKVTFTTGAAVLDAARQVRRQVLVVAAQELEAAVEDLEMKAGQVHVRGVLARGLTLSQIAQAAARQNTPIAATGRAKQASRAPAFCAQLAEVDVDRDTGEVRVLRLIAIQDAGRAINPPAVEGQILGGMTQGIGWALYEQMQYDTAGQLLTGTWMDYAIPRTRHAAQQLEATVIELPSPNGPFGARGVGEVPVVAAAAAIANAIADATGLRLTDLPMTAPRLIEGMFNSEA